MNGVYCPETISNWSDVMIPSLYLGSNLVATVRSKFYHGALITVSYFQTSFSICSETFESAYCSHSCTNSCQESCGPKEYCSFFCHSKSWCSDVGQELGSSPLRTLFF